MSTVSGVLARSPAITAGQNSSAGSGPAWPAQVLAKTWLVISMAMSQRIPSHCSAMSSSVSAVAARIAGENAFSCATSGHGGKYGSRPWARMRAVDREPARGSAARSSARRRGRTAPGGSRTQG